MHLTVPIVHINMQVEAVLRARRHQVDTLRDTQNSGALIEPIIAVIRAAGTN